MRTKHCRRAQLLALIERTLTLRLYTNEVNVNDSVKLGDFVEAAGGGYEAKTLATKDWKIHGRLGDELATHPSVAWEFTGRVGWVHGIYLVDEQSELILEVYQLEPPEFIRQAGDEITVTNIVLR